MRCEGGGGLISPQEHGFVQALQGGDGVMEGGAVMSVLVFCAVVFLIVLALLWFLLPFAVFGIKERMDRAEKVQNEILQELKQINNNKSGVSL